MRVCLICGSASVESGDGHDDDAQPYCLAHLAKFDPEGAELPLKIAGVQRGQP